jgi:hypothetical protein
MRKRKVKKNIVQKKTKLSGLVGSSQELKKLFLQSIRKLSWCRLDEREAHQLLHSRSLLWVWVEALR